MMAVYRAGSYRTIAPSLVGKSLQGCHSSHRLESGTYISAFNSSPSTPESE